MEKPLQLRIPGPVPLPPAVMRELMRPAINHRGPEAKAVNQRVAEGVARLFGSSQPAVLLTSSGTGAMEAAVINTVAPGDKVLVLVGGRFGERWAQIASALGADVDELRYDFRIGANPDEVADRIRGAGYRAVFATHNESSTGVLNNIAGLAEAVRSEGDDGPLLVVDAISGLGGAPFRLDEWGVDVAVTGSQKCLMSPPGLAFIALGPRGLQRVESIDTPRYYFDLRKYVRRLPETPYTPAMPLLRAVDAALGLIFEEGLENVYDRHRLLRDMVRAGVRALGLSPWTEDRFASPTLTAVEVPEGIDGEAVRAVMRDEYGVEIGGGQGDLKGRLWRIGHMGYAFPPDVMAVLGAFEKALAKAGWKEGMGRAVAAAQEVWVNWA